MELPKVDGSCQASHFDFALTMDMLAGNGCLVPTSNGGSGGKGSRQPLTISNSDGGLIALSLTVTTEVSCCGSSGGDGMQQLLEVDWRSCTRWGSCEERMSGTAWFDGGCCRLEGVAAEVTSSVLQ
ncbi:hypothetical protein WN943_013608 [Citrus x changshan-huyou]